MYITPINYFASGGLIRARTLNVDETGEVTDIKTRFIDHGYTGMVKNRFRHLLQGKYLNCDRFKRILFLSL